jgi:2-polyprenyl-3-methyl-5-hydroxy-6-metoxy-1,4-benzoquinol methylase
MNNYIVAILLCCCLTVSDAVAKSRHYNISSATWENEFASGSWEYLAKIPVERARNSVICGVFALQHAPRGKILDVGCGEGVLSDYLNEEQKKNYTGIDLSHEAIKIAKKRREMLSFMQADASTFAPPPGQTYDMIVFNEMLYYMNHKEIIEKYSAPAYLSVGGIIVISVWFSKKSEVLKTSIFKEAGKILKSVDFVEVSGLTGTGAAQRLVHFHIEAFVPRGR